MDACKLYTNVTACAFKTAHIIQLYKLVGAGVDREVYSFFWKEFANSFTIGKRSRVPFVRHDHYIQEWESVARIFVKGYKTTSYYPMYLTKAFMTCCLFDGVPDIVILESFLKYLSVEEEELIGNHMGSGQLPEDEELIDFLDRFKCRTIVTLSNLTAIISELGKQELIQKPHVMLAYFQPIVKELKHLKLSGHQSSWRNFIA